MNLKAMQQIRNESQDNVSYTILTLMLRTRTMAVPFVSLMSGARRTR